MLAHIRIDADRLIEEEGLSEAEAIRRARERFGVQEEIQPTRSTPVMSWLEIRRRDVTHAVRRLRSTPLSTATILVSLVLGIGVNTAIFSIADQALVRPMPIPEPDRVVQLDWNGQWIGEGRGWGSLLPHRIYEELEGRGAVFSSLAARSPGDVTLITHAGSERARVALVTGRFFEVMGIRPAIGRLIDPQDDQILDGHPVVVLSHAYWQSRYGADSTVVGSELRLNGRSMTVIGVAPAGFHGTDWSRPPVLWTSMMMNGLVHSWGTLEQPRVRFQHIYGRLADGTTRSEAEEAIQGWFQSYLRADMEHPDWPSGRDPGEVQAYLASRLALIPGGTGQADRSEELTRPVLILTTATALLLLLACLNVANLSLAKTVTRHRDTAVRTALGASRGRIVTERLVESGLLALAGTALGVLLAPPFGRWILNYLEVGTSATALDPGVDLRMLFLAGVTAVVVTLLAGVGPAWFASSVRPMGALRTRGPGRAGLSLRKALVVGQISLALILLIGAGLFGRTLRTLRNTGPGFETEQLVSFAVNPGNDGFDRVEAQRLLEEIHDAVATLPGVEGSGMAAFAMLTGGGWGNPMLVEADRRFVTEESLPMNAVTPGFFNVLGVEILRGRDFLPSDRIDGEEWAWDKVIVSQSFVDRYLSGWEALGTHIDFGRDPDATARMEIIGVVEDYQEKDLREPIPQVYFPILAQTRRGAVFYLRTRAPLATIAPVIRDRVAQIRPVLTVSAMRTFDQQLDELLVFERMLSSLGALFALIGTVLAMIGIYGVLSFQVQLRTHEMGIRIALGARRGSASRLILAEAGRLAVTGVIFALPVVWLLGRLMESQLYGVRAIDPAVLGIAGGVVLLLCLAASLGPAIRMSRTSPVEAFRIE
jgi:predicted permease